MSTAAIDLSQALASLVEANGPGVVRVEGRARFASSGAVFSQDGTIVAADHAVERDEDVTIGIAGGSTLAARVVGRDPTTDVCVLKVDASGLATPQWGELSGLKVGHLVVAISRPGRTARARAGIVSALGDGEWRTPAGGKLERYLEPDLELAPGTSGSVLADASGRALGIVTSGLLRHTPVAIPTATLRRVVAEISAHGSVRRGFLGIGAHSVELPPPLAKLAGAERALLIISVEPDSPADKAGLLLGDVLFSFAGTPIADVGDLLALLDAERIGTSVVAKIIRAGEVKEVTAAIGARS